MTGSRRSWSPGRKTMREFEIRTDPVQINAPIDVVWSVLTEVDKYREWNPFTPQAGTDFTIGFHHAWEDLNPGRCFVVYSGYGRYPMSEVVEVMGLEDLCRTICP